MGALSSHMHYFYSSVSNVFLQVFLLLACVCVYCMSVHVHLVWVGWSGRVVPYSNSQPLSAPVLLVLEFCNNLINC